MTPFLFILGEHWAWHYQADAISLLPSAIVFFFFFFFIKKRGSAQSRWVDNIDTGGTNWTDLSINE